MDDNYKFRFNSKQNGVALIMTLVFVMVFSALAAALLSMSVTSVQASQNHQESNQAMSAALSGLEFAKYLASDVSLPTVLNYDEYNSDDYGSHADTLWSNMAANEYLPVSDTNENGLAYLETGDISYTSGVTFNVRFTRQSANTITVVCTGENKGIQRVVGMTFNIEKEGNKILNYGLVGNGRMWLAGDTTIHGDIYSSWDNASVSPFNMTDDSAVRGTINTVLSKDTVDSQSWDMETTDSDDNALFNYGVDVYDADGDSVSGYGRVDDNGYLVNADGNAVYDIDGNRVPVDYTNRVVSYDDEIQGYHEGIYYDVDNDPEKSQIIDLIDPFLDIDNYDTSVYYNTTSGNVIEPDTTIQTVTHSGWQFIDGHWQYVTTTEEAEVPVTTTEYFPHGPDGYDDYKSGSVTLERYVHENQTYNNAYLEANQNALFKNCAFEGILYIDCSAYTSSQYNNVRFEDCEFNGVIVTNTPDELSWQRNALYFTGSANFNNTSDIQEATILAPHFNVNLGDANNGEVENDENVIKGLVVGGIVDIRGNAEIEGTVISMCDTSQWTNGFVTNIGATLNDGGSETTSIEDIGTIEITPDPQQKLCQGFTNYPCTISLRAANDTYYEIY